MSVRSGLLALLAEGEKYGAQLRSEFEGRTGGTWPLNVGQVYTTLDRLVRDGLVEQAADADADGRIAYRLTPAGHAELTSWWSTPVDRTSTPRDELTIKLALAVTAPGVDVHHVVQTQRTATLRHLRDLTRLKRGALGSSQGAAGAATPAGPSRESTADDTGLAWLLVLENLVFAAEAEVRWLDHVETMLARRPRPATPAAPTAEAAPEGPTVPHDATAHHTTTGSEPVGTHHGGNQS